MEIHISQGRFLVDSHTQVKIVRWISVTAKDFRGTWNLLGQKLQFRQRDRRCDRLKLAPQRCQQWTDPILAGRCERVARESR